MTTGSAPAHLPVDDAAIRRAEVDAEICQWLVEADEEREAILHRAEADAAETLRVAVERAAAVVAAAQDKAADVMAQAEVDGTRLRAEAASGYLREVADGRAVAARLVAEARVRGERERAEMVASLEPVRAELEEARTAMLRAVHACEEVRPVDEAAGEPPSLTLVRPAASAAAPAAPAVRWVVRPGLGSQLLDALPMAAGDFVRRLPRRFARP